MANRQELHLSKNSSILLTAARWLRRSVNEIFRLSEVGGLQPWIFPVLTQGNQLLTEQSCYIHSAFLRGQTEEGSANVCSPCEVHLICMLRVPGFQYCGLYKSFRYIIQEKPRVHFLLNMHGFAGVEAGHSDGVFQIAVGALNLPPRKIESGEPLRWELREGKICDETLIRAGGKLYSDSPKGHRVSIVRTVLHIVKGNVCPYKTGMASWRDGNFL